MDKKITIIPDISYISIKDNLIHLQIADLAFLKKTLNLIHTSYPNFDILTHSNINDISRISTLLKFNFYNPLILKKSPVDNTIFSKPMLCLTKYKSPQASKNIIHHVTTLNDIYYTLDQFLNHQNMCSLTMKLTTNTINYIKTLPYEKNGAVQNEIVGSFILSSITKNKTCKFVYTLDVDTNSIKYGTEENVEAVNSKYNFHSHPEQAYIKYNVKNAWPSSDDCVAFIKTYIKFDTIFHIVVSIEGIYVISLGKHFIGDYNINEVEKKVRKIYEVSDKLSVDGYLKKIEACDLLVIQFVKWDSVNKPITINFPKNNDNCVVY